MPNRRRPVTFADGSSLDPLKQQIRNLDEKLTDSTIHLLAERAADRALDKMFMHLGYDLQDAESVRSLNADLAYMRGLRLASENVKGIALKIIATSLIGAMVAALVQAWRTYLKN